MERGVVFTLQDRRFALPLDTVVRVVRAVYVTAVPDAPTNVFGVIDVQGEIVPVVDLRAQLAMPRRALELSDRFVIVRAGERTVALWVDRVHGVVEWDAADYVAASSVLPGSRHLRAIARGDDGLLVVHDLDGLLALRAGPAAEISA